MHISVTVVWREGWDFSPPKTNLSSSCYNYRLKPDFQLGKQALHLEENQHNQSTSTRSNSRLGAYEDDSIDGVKVNIWMQLECLDKCYVR